MYKFYPSSGEEFYGTKQRITKRNNFHKRREPKTDSRSLRELYISKREQQKLGKEVEEVLILIPEFGNIDYR
jgi:hypothetical protein